MKIRPSEPKKTATCRARRPAVREPTTYSNEAQDIVTHAVTEAAASMGVWPWSVDTAADRLKDELGSARQVREFYERALYFIARAKTKRPSRKGLPVDRAEARLHLWNRLYGMGRGRRGGK